MTNKMGISQTHEHSNIFWNLDKEMFEYRKALKDKNSKEYQDHLRCQEIFSRPFKFSE